MKPLERAARALHKDYVEGRVRMGVRPADLPAWEDLGPDGEFSFYAPARAVLQAIREPSEAMVKAMGAKVAAVGHDDGTWTDVLQGWQSAIDAALEEG